jgi:hypothetical protein
MIVRRIPQSLDQFLLRDLGAVIALVGYPVGPIIVGPLYFGMGYASWVIANLLVGSQVKRPKIRYALFAIPLIAEFVMTQWDTVMDPSGSTLGKTWLWYDSGGYFGVPLSNFLGRLLVTWLYFQIFAISAYKRRTRVPYPSRLRAAFLREHAQRSAFNCQENQTFLSSWVDGPQNGVFEDIVLRQRLPCGHLALTQTIG